MRTSRAQPSGSRAVAKCRLAFIGRSPRAIDYVYTLSAGDASLMVKQPESDMRCDRLWSDARLATMAGPGTGAGLGIIERGVIAAQDGRIVYAGAAADAPAFEAAETIACDGRWITPGLIDCHTHLVHGGDRAHEFELRLGGASYEEIARAGGGIVSTMRATRAAGEADLVAAALPRLDTLIGEGVTTVEVKSGYGLERDTELRMLRAAR